MFAQAKSSLTLNAIRSLLAIGMVLASSASTSQQTRVLNGEQLRINDLSGKTRVFITASGPNDSHTILQFLDQSGRNRMQIIAFSDDRPPIFEFFNASGQKVQSPSFQQASSGSARPIRIEKLRGEGKADGSISLQVQIDEIRNKVNEIASAIGNPR